MVTGYDHLLFLAGVIFFLYRLKDVALYVTLFAVGHSTTLLLGVLGGWHVERVSRRRGDRLIGGLQGVREPRRIPPRSASSRTRRRPCCSSAFSTGSVSRPSCRISRSRATGSSTNMVRSTSASRSGSCSRSSVMLIVFNAWRTTRQLHSPRVRRQRRVGSRWLRPVRLPAHGLRRRLKALPGNRRVPAAWGVGKRRRMGQPEARVYLRGRCSSILARLNTSSTRSA